MNIYSFGLIAAGIILVLMGPIFIGKGGYEIYRTVNAQGWPTAQGEITSSSVETKETIRVGKPSTARYELNITYRYTVGGNAYSSDRLTFGSINKNSESYANQQLADYPIGTAVEVHYNPEDPREAALKVGVTLWTWANLLIGVVGPVLGVPLLRWTVKTIREDAADTG